MRFIVKLLLTAAAVLITSYILPGVHTADFGTAFLVAALLALLNATIKPLIIILTIPITFLTLGLFLLFINAFIIMLADSIIDGFTVDGFWWALLFSLILSFLVSLFDKQVSKDENRQR